MNSTLLKKYETIDQSKVSEKDKKVLEQVKKLTNGFEETDEAKNKVAEKILDQITKINPDAVKKPQVVAQKVAKVQKVAKAKKATQVKKTATTTTASTAKGSSNNIMSVAKEVQKSGESWKDAMERAKVILKERREQGVEKRKTDLEKLYALVKTRKELEGFANSDIDRDSRRIAFPRGRRVSQKGWKNQYGTSDGGKVYYENRENRTDRLAPNYPKDLPLLASGGMLKVEDSGYGYKNLLGYEPYFEKDVTVASFSEEEKVVRPSHGYFYPNPMAKKVIRWAKKNGYEFIQDGKKYADGGMTNLTMQNVSFAKGGKVKHTFEVGQTISYPITKSTKLDKGVKNKFNKYAEKELVIDEIITDTPYNTAKVSLKSTGEKLTGEVILNPRYITVYANGGNIDDSWDLKMIDSDEDGSYGKVVHNGKEVADYNFDRYARTFWVESPKGGQMGIDTPEELFAFYKAKGFADGGSVSNERMYNFLQDDLQKLEEAIKSGDMEEVNKFFTYWLGSSSHLKSLETKTNERMYNFLKEDLEKLEVAVENNDTEEVERFFSYWGQHLESLKMANGGSLPYMTDPNFGDFQNTGAFAHGGYFDKLEEVKFVFNVGEKIKIPQIGSKGKLELLDAEIIEQYPAEQNDGTYYPFYYVKGMWENSGKMLYDEEKLLEYGNNPKNSFELGGAFVTTDLAGHTGGGTGGLDAGMPLSGTSGTYYTGLVGETGAMSSGELFENGGAMMQNQQVINDASQSYVNYYLGEGASQGIYKDGGSILSQYLGRTPEDIWNNLNEFQTQHFLLDHADEFLNEDDGFDIVEKLKILSWEDLPNEVQESFESHIEMGQYAYGGKTKSRPSMRQLNIEQIASLTGTRNVEGVEKFVDDNNLTDSEVSNLMMGIGRGLISKGDFITALVGNKNNPIQKEVIAFAKSNKAYKMADGGFTPDVSDGTQFMSGVYAKGGETSRKGTYTNRIVILDNGDSVMIGNISGYRGTGEPVYDVHKYGSLRKNMLEKQGELSNNKIKELLKKDKYSDGGSFSPNVSNGTEFMDGVYAKGGKIKVGGDDFTFLLDLTDNELQKRLDLVNKQKNINAKQYFDAKDKKENTSKIEEAGTRLDNQWYAILEARNRKNKNYANGGSFAPNVSNGTEFMDGVYADGGAINGMLNKKIKALADKKGLTMDALGRDEYNKVMTQALVESLTDANFHDEAKQVVVKTEGKTKWSDDLYRAESFNPDAEVASFAREVARICEWDGDDILNGFYFVTKMEGSKVGGMIDDLFLNPKPTKSTTTKTDWWHTVVNPNEDFNNFDDKMPIDWEVDDFKSWIVSESDLDGNVDKAVLDVVKMPQSKLLVEYLNKNGSGKNNDEYYKEFGNWQSALYDIFTQMKKDYLASTSSSKPTKYIDHADIKSVRVKYKGKEVTFKGEDVLNGANLMEKGGDLSDKAFYIPKRDVIEVELKDGTTIKPANGYWVKKGSEPIKEMETNGGDKDFKIGDYVKKNEKDGSIVYGTQGFIYEINQDFSEIKLEDDYGNKNPKWFKLKGFRRLKSKSKNTNVSNNIPSKTTTTAPKTDETKAHFKLDVTSGGKFEVFVDSNFVNQAQGNLPNTELKHYGFGDFYLQTPDGNIDFIRTSEEKQGFVGRTHKMRGSDELVLKLVNAMKEKGRFESTQTFANGGAMGSGFDPVKVKVVLAVGLDRAIEFYDAEYPIRPYQLLEKAVRKGFITLDEINERVVESAMETGQDSEDMEEVGSSDETYAMQEFLDESGFKVGFVNGRLTREFADGGFMNGVYAKGGEIADIQKMKKMLIAKAKSRGIYENFGQKEVRVLEDKYGYTNNVRDFDNWAMNFDLSKMADGGFMNDVYADGGLMAKGGMLVYLDGEKSKSFKTKKALYEFVRSQTATGVKKVEIDYGNRIIPTFDTYVIEDGKLIHKGELIQKNYNKEEAEKRRLETERNLNQMMGYADGGMFDDNDGFMKADNNRNFRYPKREMNVDTIDEPIDLTDNVSYAYNEVTVMPLNDEIDLTESSRMRVGKPYVEANRTPEKMMAVNQRMTLLNLPKPNSQSHRNND
jgi:hypothetical protein